MTFDLDIRKKPTTQSFNVCQFFDLSLSETISLIFHLTLNKNLNLGRIFYIANDLWRSGREGNEKFDKKKLVLILVHLHHFVHLPIKEGRCAGANRMKKSFLIDEF